MSVRLRVKDGTRPDKRLCDTCQNSTIIKGPQQGQEAVLCSSMPSLYGHIPFPIVECSGYLAKGEMQEWEAKQIGWVLEVKAGKVMGFKPPTKSGTGIPE